MSEATATAQAPARPDAGSREMRGWEPPSYWPFIVPALVVVLGVIIFPWVYTIWMSLHEWKVGSPPTFVGLANYIRLPSDSRFVESIGHTLVYTALSVVLPLAFGTFAAVVFHAKFPMRGFLRGLFIMPMMATPVAIALVWTMMFHPQLGILNYLLSLVGIPAATLGVSPRNRDSLAGAGRDLAMDAAGDADRARRAGGNPGRALRKRADRPAPPPGRPFATSRCR